ncbi:C4-dicarboxylate ABC transporter permease [Hoeflea sp. BAL378]|uniref:TRAP transporter small permease n=1 Tax=Hoeflea sp. BAL378 TaxID=1547437 RepID=UPI0005143CC8|nr:TRAP transporter small permease [Hoeflea sp. BAL378]KGF69781.1 C4-dicarboxylate ABC transporter permease [Hoeflea sp. BAL378]
MLVRFYDRMITGLAITGGISLVIITIAIIIDVVLRNTGFRPSQSTSALVEYVMLYSTMAAAPWLVRNNGHIAITSFVERLPGSSRLFVGRAVLILCIVMLGLLSWRSGAVGLQMLATASVDMRSINIPSWVLYAMLSGGFGLMTLEFLRMLFKGHIYTGSEATH